MAAARRDVLAETTARIVAALEAGVVPWVRPWSIAAAHLGPDRNAATGRRYNGTNVVLLWLTRQERGYLSPLWLTFHQAQQLGGHVRRGERGTPIVFWNARTVVDTPDADDDERDERRVVWPRSYTVFNTEQCSALPEAITAAAAAPEALHDHARVERCEAIVATAGVVVHHGGSQAFYRPSTDTIHMPSAANFESAEHYYATLFHELTHWTGHESRCDRKLGKRFGDDAYAVEELIAELGSAFLCDHLAVPGQLRHAEYLGHWLRVLRADKRAIFSAASKTRAAVEFLLASAEPRAAAA